jgi:uncharacterized protein (DUF2147 family)
MIISALAWLAAGVGSTADVEGYWITADRTAVVRVGPCGADVCGTVTRVLARGSKVPSTDVNNPQPSLRSRPLVGLQVLSEFALRGSDWVDGRAYDPETGRSYKARLTPNPDGTLTVTGCVLFICQSQRWTRMR